MAQDEYGTKLCQCDPVCTELGKGLSRSFDDYILYIYIYIHTLQFVDL